MRANGQVFDSVIQTIPGGRFWIGSAERRTGAIWRAEFGEGLSGPAISSRGQLAFSQSLFNVNIRKVAVGHLESSKQSDSAQVIVSTRTETSPAVSPAGDRLAFVSDRTGFTEVWTSRIDGSDPLQVTSLRRAFTGSPSWSPDGSRIAFDSRVGGEALIYAIAAGAGSPVQISAFPGIVPVWSPDAKWIYFSSKQSGSMQVWRTPCAGGPAEQVTSSGGFSWKFSPDGKLAYYLGDNGEHSDLYVYDRAERKSRVIASSVFRRGFAPATGGVYYFTGPAYGRVPLEFFDLSTGAAKEVEAISGVDARGMSLSPDEKFLFHGQVEHRSAELKLVEQFWK